MRTLIKVLLWASFALMVIPLVLFYRPDLPLNELKKAYAYRESGFVEVDGIQVHYRMIGSGPALLLLHGTGASLHTWEGWTRELQDSFRVVSLDLPAFGLTGPHPRRDYSIDTYVSFLQNFCKEMRLDSFYLAGNSLGGLIAWNYAIAHAEQVGKLILIDPAGMPRQTELPLALRLGRNPISGSVLRWVTPRALFWKSLREVYHDDTLVTDDLVDRYYRLFLRPGNRQAFVDRARQDLTADTSMLQQISMPTLIQWGRYDQWILPANALLFHRAIQASELLWYESGHVPMEEIPEKTAADARAFLLSGH